MRQSASRLIVRAHAAAIAGPPQSPFSTTASASASASGKRRVVVVDGARTPFMMSGTEYNGYMAYDLARFAIKVCVRACMCVCVYVRLVRVCARTCVFLLCVRYLCPSPFPTECGIKHINAPPFQGHTPESQYFPRAP